MMPETVVANIIGTLSHDGAYPLTHMNPGWPTWYPTDAGQDPVSGGICPVPYVYNDTYHTWISPLYQDFSISWNCAYRPHPFACPSMIGFNNVTYDYFYFVALNGNLPTAGMQGCSVMLGQFVRITIRRSAEASGGCLPFNTTTVEWSGTYGGFGCTGMHGGVGIGCGGILTCSPFQFKKSLQNTGASSVISSITVGPCPPLFSPDEGNPTLTIVYEPSCTVPGSTPYAEIVL